MVLSEVVGIVLGTLAISGTVGGIIIYFVRKHDKIKAIPDDMPLRLTVAEGKIEKIFTITDRLEENIDQINGKIGAEIKSVKDEVERGFSDSRFFSGLILDGMKSIMEATPDIKNSQQVVEFTKRLSKEIRVEPRRVLSE